MAAIILKGKYYTPPYTMVMSEVPFMFDLPQGSGPAEYKRESEPFGWRVDIWNPCRVMFHSSGGLGANLEAREDGELQIELGYTYLFGLADEAPAPAPEPPPAPQPEPPTQPEPTPAPAPPVPPYALPASISITGSLEVVRPQILFWGTATWGTMEVVWILPMAWYAAAWSKGMPALLDLLNGAIQRGEYDVEYHTRG